MLGTVWLLPAGLVTHNTSLDLLLGTLWIHLLLPGSVWFAFNTRQSGVLSDCVQLHDGEDNGPCAVSTDIFSVVQRVSR